MPKSNPSPNEPPAIPNSALIALARMLGTSLTVPDLLLAIAALPEDAAPLEVKAQMTEFASRFATLKEIAQAIKRQVIGPTESDAWDWPGGMVCDDFTDGADTER